MTKKMEDIAAKAAVNSPQVLQRKEVQGELNFIRDLKKLGKKLEADNIVARFPDPEGGDPIDFEMRPMTPGETAIYYQTLLGHTLIEASSARIPDPESEIEIDDEQEQKLQDELAVKKYDTKLLNILESCIISHPGLTAEDMRTWDPFYVMSLHNALLGGSRPSKSVAQFPNVDSAGGE
ncbi:MAG: hypothetical protein OXH00_25905 [Candidatus Poribacteria bacterium]|nr:hypothetical protein [Candidatus Poribacteria bacterium]